MKTFETVTISFLDWIGERYFSQCPWYNGFKCYQRYSERVNEWNISKHYGIWCFTRITCQHGSLYVQLVLSHQSVNAIWFSWLNCPLAHMWHWSERYQGTACMVLLSMSAQLMFNQLTNCGGLDLSSKCHFWKISKIKWERVFCELHYFKWFSLCVHAYLLTALPPTKNPIK